MDIDCEWENFLNNDYDIDNINNNDDINLNNETIHNELNNNKHQYNLDNNLKIKKKIEIKNKIYISTKTKIAYLNKSIDIYDIFWKIPIINFYDNNDGILKKEIKITNTTIEESDKINKLCSKEKHCRLHELSYININQENIKKYKHIQKIEIGLCNKDIITCKVKKKGAFYNCFALILRINFKNTFKEVHVKVFNTGKLEIPGIQDDKLLIKAIHYISTLLSKIIKQKIYLVEDSIDTVLINSNFNCGFLVNRQKLYTILKTKYNILTLYDQCSYPGTQSKFYFNSNKKIQDGICKCDKKCSKKGSGNGSGQCKEISFMVFRTGSVLIVGHCDEYILNNIYMFIKNILEVEYDNIYDGKSEIKDKPKLKRKKKYNIYITR